MKWLERLIGRDISLMEIEDILDIFRQHQRYVYGVIVVMVLWVIFTSFLIPNYTDYRSKSKVLRDFNKILVLKKKQVLDKENIEKELFRLQGVLKEKRALFFTDSQMQEFIINELPDMMAVHDAFIRSVVYQKERQVEHGLKAMPVSLELEGDFVGIMTFIHSLEFYNKVLRVRDFTAKRKTQNPVTVKAKLILEVYVR